MRASVSGTPQWLLNDCAEACILPPRDSTWRSASLVVVLPAEPVTAMILAFERARAATPRSSSAASTSSTTIIGASSAERAALRGFDDDRTPAPALIAAVAKSCPS